jgi:uncharacterized protein (TIGR02611 family)
MINKLKRLWRRLIEAPPGKRFEQEYWRRQKTRNRTFLKKALFIGGGIIVTVAGIIELPLPGPGTVIMIAGLGLIAQESLWLSKLLDKAELLIRRLIDWGQEWWKGTSSGKKAAISILALIILGLIGYGAYWLSTHIARL